MSYITEAEFTASPFYCLLEQCCKQSGVPIATTIAQYNIIACSLIDNYVGYSFYRTTETDLVIGMNKHRFFTQKFPLVSVTQITQRCRRDDRYFYPHLQSAFSDRIIDGADVTIIDPKTGYIEVCEGFARGNDYLIEYEAGYELITDIPQDVKTAQMIIMAQLSQMIDTGNLANPDVSTQNVKFSNTSLSYGASNIIKNVTLKDIDELNAIPITAKILLNKYKNSGRMAV